MRVIDADAHVIETAATFADPYWDPALADRRPRVVDYGPRFAWLIDDVVYPKTRGRGASRVGGPAAHEGRPSAFEASKPDGIESITLSDPEARCRQMDAEGIDVQVIFPSMFLRGQLAEDSQLQSALCRSYNSWIADVCAKRADRLTWVAVVNLRDIPGAVAELKRTHERKGAGVMILGGAGDKHLNHPDILPFFAAAAELDLPVAVHAGRPRNELADLFDTPFEQILLPFTVSMFMGFVDIVAGGLLDRFERLRIAFLEAGSQWLPFLVDRMDHYAEMALQRRFTDYRAKELPSNYLRRGNVFVSCEVDDRLLPAVIDRFGEDFLIFASDIPHGDREYDAVSDLRKRADVSERAKDKILGDNTRRFYGDRVMGRPGGSV
jgi:hypothetical protein